jgi:hypothetical protein
VFQQREVRQAPARQLDRGHVHDHQEIHGRFIERRGEEIHPTDAGHRAAGQILLRAEFQRSAVFAVGLPVAVFVLVGRIQHGGAVEGVVLALLELAGGGSRCGGHLDQLLRGFVRAAVVVAEFGDDVGVGVIGDPVAVDD